LGLGRSAPGDLVFAMWNGEPRKPNTLTNDWLRATAVVGRKISLHALRHTHASQLIAAGVDILTISRRLGHASAKITLDTYGHRYGSSSDDLAAQATEKMFARIGRESSRSAGNSK
jgi:integrase